jgi:MATE family, multidrug and toxin extrusion protein
MSRIEAIELPSSFVSTAPIAHEIIAQDIADCSSSEDEYDADNDDGDDPPEPRLGFHPTGVSFGCGFSTVPVQGPDEHVANPREVEQSLHDEVLLLRDNHILPQREGFRRGSVLRHVFSTTFRDNDEPASERSPLLGPSDEREPETPPPEEIHKQFEEAVASHSIKTTWQREAQTLAFYSSSLIVTFLLHYSVTVGSVLAVGRLGMVELAAVNRESSKHTSI